MHEPKDTGPWCIFLLVPTPKTSDTKENVTEFKMLSMSFPTVLVLPKQGGSSNGQQGQKRGRRGWRPSLVALGAETGLQARFPAAHLEHLSSSAGQGEPADCKPPDPSPPRTPGLLLGHLSACSLPRTPGHPLSLPQPIPHVHTFFQMLSKPLPPALPIRLCSQFFP